MVHRRGGFTLIEVMAALTLTAFVLLDARLLADAIIGGTARLEVDAADADRLANGMRLLSIALSSTEASGVVDGEFRGTAAELQFRTTLTSPSGMPQAARLALQLVGERLELRGAAPCPCLVSAGVDGLRLDYRAGLGGSAAWLPGWVSASTPPVAVRIRLRRATSVDTLVFVLGERG